MYLYSRKLLTFMMRWSYIYWTEKNNKSMHTGMKTIEITILYRDVGATYLGSYLVCCSFGKNVVV